MVKIYEDLIAKTPDDAGLAVPLARIYAKKGDTARAQAVLNRIPSKAQDDPVVRLLKVELHLGLSDTGAALKELAQVETRLGTQAFRCQRCGYGVAGEFTGIARSAGRGSRSCWSGDLRTRRGWRSATSGTTETPQCKFEVRNSKPEQSPKSECPNSGPAGIRTAQRPGFGFRA